MNLQNFCVPICVLTCVHAQKARSRCPRTPEGGLPSILATSSRNGSKKLDRLRCEGLPSPLKNKKIIKISPKKAAFYKVVFSSFFVITFSAPLAALILNKLQDPIKTFSWLFETEIRLFRGKLRLFRGFLPVFKII